MDLGMAPAIVGRVSYTGDLGYEIWMKPEYQRYLFDLILEKGAEFGIRLFGLRALNALQGRKVVRQLVARISSALRSAGGRPRPVRARSASAVEFIGKAAAIAREGGGRTASFAHLPDRARDADVIGDEPIYFGGAVRGWVTSGGLPMPVGCRWRSAVSQGDRRRGGDWAIELLGEILHRRGCNPTYRSTQTVNACVPEAPDRQAGLAASPVIRLAGIVRDFRLKLTIPQARRAFFCFL